MSMCITRSMTKDEADAVKRLVPYADRKPWIAELLINGYNPDYADVDMRMVMRYAAGESEGSTYLKDIFTFLSLMVRGIETHECIGEKEMQRILKKNAWYKRETENPYRDRRAEK